MLAILFSLSLSAAEIQNTNVNREYIINDDLVIVNVEIDIKNIGDKPTSEYVLTFDEREQKHMNTLMVSLNRNTKHNTAKSLQITSDGNTKVVHLLQPLDSGAEQKLYVGYTLGQYLLFTSEEVTLKNMRVDVFFNTTLAFVSPYETLTSSLDVSGIAKTYITKASQLEEIKQFKKSIKVGPITEKPKKNEFFIEYFTYKALPYVTYINTTTTISHWGITKQESYVEIHNHGPKFTGEFNRIDFKDSTNCFIQNIPIRPPEESYNYWAHDESGQLQREIHLIQKDLDIPLRGPILPSWKATFSVGWTVKTETFVKGQYTFTAPLFPKPFANRGASVGSAHSEFIFPEGAVIKDIKIPQIINAKITESDKVCNLDFKGRKVISIDAENLSSFDDTLISIDYTLDPICAYYKIAYLFVGFTIIFVAIILVRRVDLSIKHEKTA